MRQQQLRLAGKHEPAGAVTQPGTLEGLVHAEQPLCVQRNGLLEVGAEQLLPASASAL